MPKNEDILLSYLKSFLKCFSDIQGLHSIHCAEASLTRCQAEVIVILSLFLKGPEKKKVSILEEY